MDVEAARSQEKNRDRNQQKQPSVDDLQSLMNVGPAAARKRIIKMKHLMVKFLAVLLLLNCSGLSQAQEGLQLSHETKTYGVELAADKPEKTEIEYCVIAVNKAGEG